MVPRLKLEFLLLLLHISFSTARSKCSVSCGLALASYYMSKDSNLTFVNEILKSDVMPAGDFDTLLGYNKNVGNKDFVAAGTRVIVPFPCECIQDQYPGHIFRYNTRREDTYQKVAGTHYANLTTSQWLEATNNYPANNIPDTGTLNVTVNCSCGDPSVSKDYGLFITYPLRSGDSLDSIAKEANVTKDILQRYNEGLNFSAGTGLAYIPGRDPNGNFPPLKTSKDGIGAGAIAGISMGVVVGVMLVALAYIKIDRKKKRKEGSLSVPSQDLLSEDASEPAGPVSRPPSGLAGITIDKSVEFPYEELALATDNFRIANKIGEGGFGAVYYAELRGEKAAIKKMEMQASKQFLAELKVLTRVHHVNLVRLIGYCVEGALFLVYEYIENGNLSQHLRGSGRRPLPWSTRLQIALDSARGLEYIHEHTVPVYVHRDIKSANILIDKNYRAKVADFGLSKLTEVGGATAGSNAMGTFGYMPPESRYGDVSAKGDVYAFGVVLYELISAKEAVITLNGSGPQYKGLVALFDEAFNQPDPTRAIRDLVDPRLENDYPFDSVFKMAELAKACTRENPQLRPSMRSVVVAQMMLSSSTGNWDVGHLEKANLVNVMSGR